MQAVEHFAGRRGGAIEWFGAPLMVIGAPSPWGPYANEKEAVLASMDVIDAVRPDWPDAAKKIGLGIGWAESRFGVTPDWQFPSGNPSWNWGAMVMKGNAGTIKHPDHEAMGKATTYDFAAWNTAEDGFRAWANMMEQARLAPALAAMKEGNARGVAEGMYAACLFSGTCPPDCSDTQRIERYAQLILGAVGHLAPLGGWDPNEVFLGTRMNVPLGKCSWHDDYKGPKPTGGGGTPTSSPSSGSSTGLLVGVGLAIVAAVGFLR